MCFGGIFDYDAKKEKLEEVSRELEDAAVWNKPEYAQALGKERSALELSLIHISEPTRPY